MQNSFHIRRTTPAALASAFVAVAALALSSCYTSPDPATMEVARSPRGVEAKLALSDRSRGTAELLAVRDTGLVVLRDGRVVFVRYERIRGARFQYVSSVALRGAKPDRRTHEHLTYLSRFPFGLSDAVLAELLSGAGQQAPDTIAARSR